MKFDIILCFWFLNYSKNIIDLSKKIKSLSYCLKNNSNSLIIGSTMTASKNTKNLKLYVMLAPSVLKYHIFYSHFCILNVLNNEIFFNLFENTYDVELPNNISAVTTGSLIRGFFAFSYCILILFHFLHILFVWKKKK